MPITCTISAPMPFFWSSNTCSTRARTFERILLAAFGASGIVVSNHGGRQLDGVPSTAKVLPQISDAVGNDLVVLADSGIRSGLDVVRMLALGAKGVLLGRAAAFALAAAGQAGVERMLGIFEKEMRAAMTLTGLSSVGQINRSILA